MKHLISRKRFIKTAAGLVLPAWACSGQVVIPGAIMRTIATAGGGGTPTFIQDDGASFDPFNDERTVTFGSSTVSGRCIIAVYQGSNAASLVVEDSKSNTYNTVVDGATSGVAIAVALNITGGASHIVTFTVTSHSNPAHIVVLEYSNVAAAAAVDQTGQDDGFVTNLSITTGTLAQAVELLFGAMRSASVVPTAGAGMTMRHIQSAVLYTEDGVSASTAAQTIGFTHAEANVGLSIVTLKGN